MHIFYKLFLASFALFFIFGAGFAHAAQPEIEQLMPASATVGHGAFTFIIEGEKINANTEVYFYWYENIPTTVAWCFTPDGGGGCGTVSHNDDDLLLEIPANFFNPAWAYWARIINPGPGGGTSNAVIFAVYNAPPTADNRVYTTDACQAVQDTNSIFFTWTYNDADNDNEKKFILQIARANDPNFNCSTEGNPNWPCPVNRSWDNLNQPAGTTNQQVVSVLTSGTEIDSLAYNRTYYWRVRVKQEQPGAGIPFTTNNSAWVNGPSLTTIAQPYPYVDFASTATSPAVNFTNNSICYDADEICNSYLWSFGDGQNSNLKNPSHAYNPPASYNVSLAVTDGDGFQCQAIKTVSAPNPAFSTGNPFWKETSPFQFPLQGGGLCFPSGQVCTVGMTPCCPGLSCVQQPNFVYQCQ